MTRKSCIEAAKALLPDPNFAPDENKKYVFECTITPSEKMAGFKIASITIFRESKDADAESGDEILHRIGMEYLSSGKIRGYMFSGVKNDELYKVVVKSMAQAMIAIAAKFIEEQAHMLERTAESQAEMVKFFTYNTFNERIPFHHFATEEEKDAIHRMALEYSRGTGPLEYKS